ncbi:MAG: hypothetical protein V4722_07715 [Bacteroidota bacterium]
MKKTTIFLAIIMTLVFMIGLGCKKSEMGSGYMTDATIIGYDTRLCVCCGGLQIVLAGESQFRLIGNTASIGLTETSNYPVAVEVDWTEDRTNGCNHIIVTRFRRK